MIVNIARLWLTTQWVTTKRSCRGVLRILIIQFAYEWKIKIYAACNQDRACCSCLSSMPLHAGWRWEKRWSGMGQEECLRGGGRAGKNGFFVLTVLVGLVRLTFSRAFSVRSNQRKINESSFSHEKIILISCCIPFLFHARHSTKQFNNCFRSAERRVLGLPLQHAWYL